jgi:hypothetical protein
MSGNAYLGAFDLDKEGPPTISDFSGVNPDPFNTGLGWSASSLYSDSFAASFQLDSSQSASLEVPDTSIDIFALQNAISAMDRYNEQQSGGIGESRLGQEYIDLFLNRHNAHHDQSGNPQSSQSAHLTPRQAPDHTEATSSNERLQIVPLQLEVSHLHTSYHPG